MYIRDDLLDKIKEIFKIEKLTYIRTGKHAYNNNDLFIFNSNKGTMAIEVGGTNLYSIYETKENMQYPGYFYTITPRCILFVAEKETRLRVDGTATIFEGKAFDCTSELVLLAMEKS